jgi:predicted HicB family RNase H-like nuclease
MLPLVATDYPSDTPGTGRGFPADRGHDMHMASDDLEHPKRPKSEQRQRQVMLAARVNPDEERQIREAAKARGISVASLIRSAVLGAVSQ